jgi:hypothetical protein
MPHQRIRGEVLQRSAEEVWRAYRHSTDAGRRGVEVQFIALAEQKSHLKKKQ